MGGLTQLYEVGTGSSFIYGDPVYWTPNGNGVNESYMANANLTWETTYSHNLGLDFGFWRNRLSGSVEVYQNTTEDILMRYPVSGSGYSFQYRNAGTIRNRGIEFSVNATVMQKRDFRWNAYANVTYNQNRVIKLATDDPIESPFMIIEEGRPFRQFYMREYAGVDRETGMPLWYLDESGDETTSDYNAAAKRYMGAADPKVLGGFGTGINWKGLDFNMLWSGAAKYTAKYNEVLGNVLALDSSNSPAFYYDRWHLADVYDPNSAWIPGKYPATRRTDADNGANRLESNMQRINAAHARLKNLELGYTLPAKLLRGSGISKLRCYINLTNPLVICNKYLKEFDPEISDGNGFQYPLQKSYNLGVNITF